jgi:nicotinate dehydrogenase subunit A
MSTLVPLHVNGRQVTVQTDDPEMPLLYALRDDLGLHGPRFGCGLGQCGACTVHVDGEAVRSCVTPLSSLSAQQRIVTLEGLGSAQNLHPVQQAFIDEQAVQCGYCIWRAICAAAARTCASSARCSGRPRHRGTAPWALDSHAAGCCRPLVAAPS